MGVETEVGVCTAGVGVDWELDTRGAAVIAEGDRRDGETGGISDGGIDTFIPAAPFTLLLLLLLRSTLGPPTRGEGVDTVDVVVIGL